MASTIQLKRGSGAPTSGDLAAGELGLDLTNKKIYSSTDGSDIVELAEPPSTTTTDTINEATSGSGVTIDGVINKDYNLYVGEYAFSASLTSGYSGIAIGDNTSSNVHFQTLSSGFTSNDGFYVGINDTTGYVWNLENSAIRFGTNSTQRVIITETGRVGINTVIPTSELEVDGKIKTTNITVGDGSAFIPSIAFSSDTDTGFFTLGNNTMSLATAGSLRITFSDNTYFTTTSNASGIPSSTESYVRIRADSSAGIYIENCLYSIITNETGTYYAGQFGISGIVKGSIYVTASGTAYNTTSDYRVKENVTPIDNALTRINSLNPVRFNFIEEPSITVDGFLAHEVTPVVPEAVTGEKDAIDENGNPVYQGIDQSKLVPLLVAAIKELSARIAILESK